MHPTRANPRCFFTRLVRVPRARTASSGLQRQENNVNMKDHRTLSVLRALLAGLALTMLGTAAADEGGREAVAGSASTNATLMSSEQVEPPDSWFKLDALDLNVYGFSYHPDRETAHRLNLDNEVNPGLGLHYEFSDSERGTTFAEIGAYQDSGSNLAKFAALGYQFKFAKRWRIGGALAIVHSRTYNEGVAFVAMIPLITYDMGRVKLNATYLPKLGHHNEVAAFGFYISIPFGQFAR